MSERTRLLTIGTVVNIVVILATVLVTAYFGNFESKADSTAGDVLLGAQVSEEKASREKDIALLKKDLKYLKEGQTEMKEMLKGISNK